MSECKHNRVEREVAVADGMCPICLAADNARLRAALEQIAIVCTDNMSRECNHRMALDFVRQIANDTEGKA